MHHPDGPTLSCRCPVPISELEPTPDGHHCRACNTRVLGSAQHRRAELLEILARGRALGEKLCVGLYRDAAGRVIFADSPLRRGLRVLTLSAALAGCDDGMTYTPGPPAWSGPQEDDTAHADEASAGEEASAATPIGGAADEAPSLEQQTTPEEGDPPTAADEVAPPVATPEAAPRK